MMTAARRFLLLGDTSTATSSSHGAREAAASIRGLVRVVSLLPSATETLAAIVKLSLKNKANSTETTSTCTAYSASVSAAGVQLVGRSHECTHPLDFVSNVPILTSPRTEWTNSRNVHSQVTTALSSSCSSSLYSLDSTLLSHLNPHIILTQSDCQVCSIHVNAITTSSSSSSSHDFDDDHPPPIPINPRIITINSHTLTDALVDNVLQIGRAVGLDKEAQELVNQNLKRLDFIKQRVEERKKKKRGNSPPHPPRVMVVEWLDPVFLAQGWTRELVELAGGEYVVNAKDGSAGRQPDSCFSQPGSLKAHYQDIDIIIVSLCGLTMNAAVKELNNNTTSDDSRLLLTRDQMGWDTLRAVKTGRVFVVDGDGMFHRPTGRLLDALEWLESVIREKEQEEGDDEIRIKNNNSNDSNSDSIIPYVKWSTSQSSSSSKSSASSSTQDITQIEELHTQACLACKSTYKDPSTGYSVMTEHALLKRGECCGNACRHCPYGHIGVKEVGRRRNRAQRPVILAGNKKKNKKRSRLFSRLMEPLFHQQQQQQQQDGSDTTAKITIVFWSGGKDSLLALVHVLENRNEMNDVSPLFLLTTFDPETRMVPIQNIPIEDIIAQAEALGLPLCLVPIVPPKENGGGDDYVSLVSRGLDLIESDYNNNYNGNNCITELVFGDLHLEDIRAWREAQFGSKSGGGRVCSFPLFGLDARDVLLPRLARLVAEDGVKIMFSSIESDRLKTWLQEEEYGDLIVSSRGVLRGSWPEGVDLMGENGEFHTRVVLN